MRSYWSLLSRCHAALKAGNSKLQIEHVVLPDGEQYKSLDVLQKVWDKALESRLDRNATFVALGGGVIGDMTGFAAAAYQRGVHFIQVIWLGPLDLQDMLAFHTAPREGVLFMLTPGVCWGSSCLPYRVNIKLIADAAAGAHHSNGHG